MSILGAELFSFIQWDNSGKIQNLLLSNRVHKEEYASKEFESFKEVNKQRFF